MSEKNDYKIADRSSRLSNHIVDWLSFCFLIFIQVMVLSEVGALPEEGSSLMVIWFFIFYVLFHAVFEYFYGKTPGKFLSKTRVIKEDGSKPSLLIILWRSFARLIPFDAITYLFTNRGLHDAISGTLVVCDKK